jgi:hypothetical protein
MMLRRSWLQLQLRLLQKELRVGQLLNHMRL